MAPSDGSARPAPRLVGSTVASLDLPAEPASARKAREFTRAQLHGADASTVETAILLTSELVTNAVLHARTPLRLDVEQDGRTLKLSVSDGDRVQPQRRPQSTERLDGRGIALVAALSREWGSVVDGRGKTVWCVLDLPGRRP